MLHYISFFLQVAALCAAVLAAWNLTVIVPGEDNPCTMTYNSATYEEVVLASPGPAKRLSSFGISRLASRYRLFKVRQGGPATSSDSDISSVSGDPVLFVHGNLGDYRQVRSLDSMAFGGIF